MAREYVLHGFHREGDPRIDYAAELNPQQYAAATAPPGPALVLAGAGSGKTRTLTYRVAYLIEHGVPADRILLLTFTNKAAREMMRRVADLLGSELGSLWGGTFHSIGARVLRIHAEALGYRGDFTILDRDDSEALVKTCVGAIPEPPKVGLMPKAEVLLDLFSRAANERRSLAQVIDRYHAGLEEVQELIGQVEGRYRERKRAGNLMDFDDLLALWLHLLEQNPEVRERYQRRFQFVLVDEYQDTNQIQSDLIDLLAAGHRNIMAVGDDSQSIYSWRGANFRNILDFPRRYPGAQVYKIELNYRSTPEILAVANAAIAANTSQFAKQLGAARRSGMRPVSVPCEDTQQQAGFVAQRIRELHEEGISLPEIAILYRSHFHALEVQLELTRQGIPFMITSGLRFFEQAHLKDVAAWLKLVANPADEVAFKRIVLLFPGVGPRAAEKLWEAFSATPAGPGGEEGGAGSKGLAARLMGIRSAVPKKAAAAWASFATTISQVERPPVVDRPGEIIRLVVEAFYEDYAAGTFANVRARLDDLEQLAAYAGQFGSLTDLLTQLSLLSNLEAEAEQRSPQENDDKVRLSTVHQAKGLEFQVVFVIMLNDGLFPSGRSLDNPEAEEEERRLFYVAVTRAKDELYLCHPLFRSLPGQGATMLSRSRFLREIPVDLVEEVNLRPAWCPGGSPAGSPPDRFADAESGDEDPF